MILTDKINVVHKVDLDNLEFVLQERGELLFPKLDQLVRSGEEEKAKAMIDSLSQSSLSAVKREWPTAIRRSSGISPA